jgi:hypothetical protein
MISFIRIRLLSIQLELKEGYRIGGIDPYKMSEEIGN